MIFIKIKYFYQLFLVIFSGVPRLNYLKFHILTFSIRLWTSATSNIPIPTRLFFSTRIRHVRRQTYTCCILHWSHSKGLLRKYAANSLSTSTVYNKITQFAICTVACHFIILFIHRKSKNVSPNRKINTRK